MSKVHSYTEARANFAKLWDQTVSDREPIRIQRRGQEDIVVLPADELDGLLETAHLLRSPRNAERLLKALTAARGKSTPSQTLDQLRTETGLE